MTDIERLQSELATERTAREKAEKRIETLRGPAQKLVDAMETCHICKGLILVEEGPTHCENCSYDCEDHDEPECERIDVLHRELKRALDADDAVKEGR